MLVVDVDALRAIDLLHFLNQVVLQRGLALDAQNVVRVERALVEAIARLDFVAFVHRKMRAVGDVVFVLFARCIGDVHHAPAFFFAEFDFARDLGDRGLALGFARFEDFFDTRQTRDDVFGCNAAGVERAQRELRARFTDGLRGDDADGLADIGTFGRSQDCGRSTWSRCRNALGT